MKFTFAVTFDIDPDKWAQEYELDDAAEATQDIARILSEAAQDGAIADALTAQWPMMREAATIAVGEPTAMIGTPGGDPLEPADYHQRRDNSDQVMGFVVHGTPVVVFSYSAPHSPQVFTFTDADEADRVYDMAVTYMTREDKSA